MYIASHLRRLNVYICKICIANQTNTCEACLLTSAAAVLLVSNRSMIYKKGLLREVAAARNKHIAGQVHQEVIV
jgi:hypothetical protein